MTNLRIYYRFWLPDSSLPLANESDGPEMVRPTLLPCAKFVLFGFLVCLLSTSRVLAQAPSCEMNYSMTVAKPLRELAVSPPAMPSGIREADELEMLALTPGFKNMGRGGKGRD